MENLNVIRKVDELGRIVLPKDVREMLGWEYRDNIMLSVDIQAKTLTLKLSEKYSGPKCVFCGADKIQMNINGSDICVDCVEKVKEV